MDNTKEFNFDEESGRNLITSSGDEISIQPDTLNSIPPGKSFKPSFALLKLVIGRAAYDLSAMGQKLFLMSISVSKIQRNTIDMKEFLNLGNQKALSFSGRNTGISVRFHISDFLKSFQVKDGGKSRKLIYTAVESCRNFAITLPSEDGDEIMLHPYRATKISPKNDMVELVFDDAFLSILDSERPYLNLNLEEISMLSSRYAIRLYIYMESYRGFMGKNGNPPNAWWASISVAQYRKMLSLENTYKDFSMFKKRCIELPLQEINTSIPGRNVEVYYTKSGRSVSTIKFFIKITEEYWDFNDIGPVLKLLAQEMSNPDYKRLVVENKEQFLLTAKNLNQDSKNPLDPHNIMFPEHKAEFRTLFLNCLSALNEQVSLGDRIVEEISTGNFDFK